MKKMSYKKSFKLNNKKFNINDIKDLEIDRSSHYVMPIHHIKGNTQKIS